RSATTAPFTATFPTTACAAATFPSRGTRILSAAPGRCGSRGGERPATALTDRTVVVLLFRQLEVQVDALGLCVVEENAPLIKLRHVVVELVVAIDERPDVVAVAAGVLGNERHG